MDSRTVKNDPYLEVVYRHWSSIAMMYVQVNANKKPVMLFDIQEQCIFMRCHMWRIARN